MGLVRKLYTAYFSHPALKNVPVELQYSTTATKPYWFRGRHLPCLAPSLSILKLYKSGKINQTKYTELYKTMLDAREPMILEQVGKLPNGAILLCYEKTGDFCHRHIAATWLQERGIRVEEWTHI